MTAKGLKKEPFISKVEDIYDLPENSFILRITDESCQICVYNGIDEKDWVLVSNVVDLKNNLFVAAEGIIKPERCGTLYYIDSFYCEDIYSEQALDIVKNWVLFQKNPKLQHNIIEFIQATFAPLYILYLKHTEQLHCIFVPVQQYFKIGKYADKTPWENRNISHFKTRLDKLIPEEHITYIGHLPEALMDKPVFFTAGNYSHLETDQILKSEPCLYRANCGGNIKLAGKSQCKKKFIVDAGASYKGNGVNAKKEEALVIANHLKKLYPDYSFVPTNGRNAIGNGYSF